MAAMALPIMMLLVGACQPTIEVVHPATLVATVVPPAHALAIIGIDFDPPLGSPRLVAEGGVRLLVAIENQGQYSESDIRVSAQLLDPSDRGATRALLDETVVLEGLQPGEIRLVPFDYVTALPVRGCYRLTVHLASQGEPQPTEDSRVYDILVNGSE